jgi:hypothetical protein
MSVWRILVDVLKAINQGDKFGTSSTFNGTRVTPVSLIEQFHGIIAEGNLVLFGIKPGAPVAQVVKRLRCGKCGSGSVMAQRTLQKASLDLKRCAAAPSAVTVRAHVQ